MQIAAIGPATAVALRPSGLTVSAMPDEYVAEAVVAMLKDKVAGRRVLLARAAVARDVIPEQLRKCGADIHVVEAYRTVIPHDSIQQVRALFGPGKPAARCGDIHQLLDREQLFCPARCCEGRTAARIEGGLHRPGHQQNLAPASLGTGPRGQRIRYPRGCGIVLHSCVSVKPFHDSQDLVGISREAYRLLVCRIE